MSANLKVLIVVASTDRRGGEVSGSTLAQELRRRGVECDAVALAPGSGVRSLDLPTLGAKAKSVATFWRLRRRAAGCDVVIAYGSTALPAAAIGLLGSGIPFVYRSIGDPTAWAGGPLHRFRTRLLFKRAAKVVTLWDGAAASMSRLYGVPKQRLTVIGNARDPKAKTPGPIEGRAVREALGLTDDDRIVLFVGSLSEEKRAHHAIQAVVSLPGVVLLVAGAGPMRDELEHGVPDAARTRVHFLGQRSDVPSLLAAADVLVLPSRTEGMPGVIIEAAMCGVASVATDVGAVSELVDNGETGFVVPAADVAALADALGNVLANPERYGTAARAKIGARFVWDAVVPRWMDELSSVRRR